MTEIRRIIQAPVFARQKKRLQKKQISDLDSAVRKIAGSPESGKLKVGDLGNIRVYKFKSLNTQFLLAYEVTGDTLCLCSVGSHQNFYRNLKKYINR